MEARVLEALKASIEKWKKNAEAESFSDVVITASGCPLCQMFMLPASIDLRDRCKGCPVFERTRVMGCGNTPYDDADEAHIQWETAIDLEEDEGPPRAYFRECAKEELEFLISLLPDAERANYEEMK